MTLVYLVGGWLIGIVAGQALGAVLWQWMLAALAALTVLLLVRRHPFRRLVAGCLLMAALGGARSSASLPRFTAEDLASYNGRGFVMVEGVIVDAPDVRDTHINLRVRAETLALKDEPPRHVRGLLLAQVPRVGVFRYGDMVRLQGELVTPPELEDFSYHDYLAREGVYSLMRYAQAEVSGPRRGNPIRATLLDFREVARQTIARLLPDPQASLLAGILLGVESGISLQVRDAFNAVSATHVIVISGSNLVIIAGLMQSVARRIVKHRIGVAAVTIAGVLFYTLFVGGDPAVTRAAIMTTLGLVAAEVGRQTYGLASLAFAVLLMTAIHPPVWGDVGFQLSFLATLGLILYVEPLQNLLSGALTRLLSQQRAKQTLALLSDALVVTLAAQITTTPLMAYTFGRFSLLALPANFLIIPVQTPLIALGGLAVLAALIVWPLGQVLAWGSWLFLSWTLGVVRFFAGLPYASLEVQNIPIWTMWGVYGVMFGLTALMMQPQTQRARLGEWLRQALPLKLLVAGGIGIAALLLSAVWALPDGRLHVTFIALDAGSATLIETPSGRQILVDAGGGGRRLSAALGDALPFWERQIDLLVITQPVHDHMDGLPTILGRYHFAAVMTNGTTGSESLQPIWDMLAAQESLRVVARSGMRISIGDGVILTVLRAPSGEPTNPDDAGDPISLLISYGNARFLLPGDLDAEGETALLAAGVPLDAQVLLVPRSGHRDSSSEAFLAAVTPQIAVLAVPTAGRASLPHAETLARLEALDLVLYRTDEVGTVEVISDGGHLWVQTSR